MRNQMNNPQILFGWVLLLGIMLGFTFGMQLDSFSVGLPIGLATSLFIAKVTQRLSYGYRKLRR